MHKQRDSLARELGKRGPFGSPEQEAYLNLLRTADHLAGQFAQLFRAHRLTDAQYNVLRILRGHQAPVATRRIAAEMVTRQPDVTRLIDRLERVRLVRRERCPDDRRVVYVAITPKGLATLNKLDEPVAALHQAQLAHLGPARLRQLSELLLAARRPPRNDQ